MSTYPYGDVMAKKVLKKIMLGLCIGAAVVAGLCALALGSLGLLLRYAVNTYGPDFLHTRVELGSCTVSLASGTATLHDFVLGNPAGYSAPDALRVQSMTVGFSWLSLLRKTVILKTVEIRQPSVHYEKKAGTDNFKALLSAFQKDTQEKTSAHTEPTSRTSRQRTTSTKKLLIHDLRISEGTLTLNLPQTAGKNISLPLPRIHLTNLGAETGGASPATVAAAILTAIYHEITHPSISGTLDRMLGITATKAAEAGAEAKKGVEKIKRTLKNFLEK